MNRSTICTLTSMFLAAGCATTPAGTTIPMEGGRYEAFATAEHKDDAIRSALKAAEAACNKRRQHHIVESTAVEYQGVVSESTNAMIEKAQEVVLLESGRLIPTLSGDDDYRATILFRCEA